MFRPQEREGALSFEEVCEHLRVDAVPTHAPRAHFFERGERERCRARFPPFGNGREPRRARVLQSFFSCVFLPTSHFPAGHRQARAALARLRQAPRAEEDGFDHSRAACSEILFVETLFLNRRFSFQRRRSPRVHLAGNQRTINAATDMFSADAKLDTRRCIQS